MVTFLLKLLKWITGLASGALSVLLLLYLGMKNEDWAILASDGKVVVDRTAGIWLIVAWAIVGAGFLLFEFLYKRSNAKQHSGKEDRQ